MTPQKQAAQTPHADIIKGLREHYDKVSTHAHEWCSGIVHAIDAYEREPELLQRHQQALLDTERRVWEEAAQLAESNNYLSGCTAGESFMASKLAKWYRQRAAQVGKEQLGAKNA